MGSVLHLLQERVFYVHQHRCSVERTYYLCEAARHCGVCVHAIAIYTGCALALLSFAAVAFIWPLDIWNFGGSPAPHALA